MREQLGECWKNKSLKEAFEAQRRHCPTRSNGSRKRGRSWGNGEKGGQGGGQRQTAKQRHQEVSKDKPVVKRKEKKHSRISEE